MKKYLIIAIFFVISITMPGCNEHDSNVLITKKVISSENYLETPQKEKRLQNDSAE